MKCLDKLILLCRKEGLSDTPLKNKRLNNLYIGTKCLDKSVLLCGQKVPSDTPQMNMCPNDLYIGTKCLDKLILLLFKLFIAVFIMYKIIQKARVWHRNMVWIIATCSFDID